MKILNLIFLTLSSAYFINFVIKYFKIFLGLIERWENLSNKVDEAQRASVLQRELAAMDLEFRAAHERLISQEIILEPDHVLDERINQINVSSHVILHIWQVSTFEDE